MEKRREAGGGTCRLCARVENYLPEIRGSLLEAKEEVRGRFDLGVDAKDSRDGGLGSKKMAEIYSEISLPGYLLYRG